LFPFIDAVIGTRPDTSTAALVLSPIASAIGFRACADAWAQILGFSCGTQSRFSHLGSEDGGAGLASSQPQGFMGQTLQVCSKLEASPSNRFHSNKGI